MRYCGWMSQRLPVRERYWRAGVYVSVYNSPGAEVIWQEWSHESVLRRGLDLERWLEVNWKGVPLRRERRAVRTPAKLADCIRSYAEFLDRIDNFIDAAAGYGSEMAYEVFWAAVNERVHGFGRYASFKLLEFYRRYCETPIALPDIRPRGGWSPRMTLELLYPELADDIASHQDHPAALNLSDKLARQIQTRLLVEEGLELDLFLIEVFLCDYKQSVEGKRQYPGRSNDSELEYCRKVDNWFGFDRQTEFWAAREALTPPECRGEFRGWEGVRDGLGPVLTDYGYTWTDMEFCFAHSKEKLDVPVRYEECGCRGGARGDVAALARSAFLALQR